MKRQQGLVLVAVLWLVTLLAVLATGLSWASRQSLRGTAGTVGSAEARYLADGAVQLVLANLLEARPEDRLLADGEELLLEIPGGSARVTVIDESGKIDINQAPERLLARLFYSLDVERSRADALADAIADYRDANDLARLNGAEDADYQAAGLPWEAADAPFTSVAELQKVYGMSPEIFQAVLPYVTRHSGQSGINPEVAPLQVLLAASDASALSLEDYVRQRRDNRRDGLAAPAGPLIAAEFLARGVGSVYTLVAVGISEAGVSSTMSTTIRVQRAGGGSVIETLEWQPWVRAPLPPLAQSPGPVPVEQ